MPDDVGRARPGLAARGEKTQGGANGEGRVVAEVGEDKDDSLLPRPDRAGGTLGPAGEDEAEEVVGIYATTAGGGREEYCA